jgi:hypothetical protein
MADTQTTGAKNLNDQVLPTITSATLTSGNTYIDVNFSEGVYKTGSAALTATEFTLTFVKGAGTATNTVISSVKKNDSAVEGSASALAGGETTLRFFLTVTGTPNGAETIEIKPANGTSVYDSASNAMADTQTSGTKSLNDLLPPTITSATLASGNTYIDVNFSEGVYKTGSAALTSTEFALTFVKGAGTATNTVISSVKKNDSAVEGSASALAGGETTVRFFLTVTGTPNGAETIEIKPANGTSVYDSASNAMADTQTTGVKNLNDQVLPMITSATLTSGNTYIDVNFSEGVYKTGSAALTSTEFALTFTKGAGTATNTTISSVKKNDSAVEGSASALAGGETTLRFFLTVTGTPNGAETIEIKPANGMSVYDGASNAMADTQTSGVKSLNDQELPTITGATVATDNVYVDITFSEGVYKTGSAALTASEFAVTFTQNGGSASNATISSVKKNDNAVEGSATALTGGETTVRAFLSITGTPSGVETIEIKPANSTSIYDAASNAMLNTQTTGVKTFNGQTPPTITNATLAADNSYVDVEFSKGVYNSSLAALTKNEFALQFAQNAGNATGASIVTVTKTDTNPLAGGETTIRFNITITGIPSGVETISVKPASGSSVYDSTSVAMPESQISAAISLNDKLAPSDPTVSQLLLLSFNNVTGDVVAASEITSSESSYLDIYISSTSPDGATVPTASEASASTAHNGTLMTVGGVPKTFTDSIYYRFRDALGNKSNWVRKCTVGLTPGTYKKVSAPNPTVSGESYLSGNTLQVGTGSATAIYDVTYNATAKSIMNAIEATDTFTINASGLVSEIDDSIANEGSANSIALTSSECAATVNVSAAATYQTSLTGTAAAVTMQKGIIDVTGITATTLNITATADVKAVATGKTLAAVSGAYTIEIAGASSAAVSGAVTALTISSAVGTLDVGAEVTTLNANDSITTLNINSGGVPTLNVADTKTVSTLNIGAVKTNAMTISATGAGAVTTASVSADLTSCTLTVNDSVSGSAAIGTLNVAAQTTSFTTAGTGIITAMNINGAVPAVTIGSAITTLDVKANVTSTLTVGAAIGTLTSSAAATVTTLTVSSGGSITSNTGAGNLTITNIDQSGVASVKTIPLGSMTTAVASVKGHSANALTLTSSATLSSCTITAGVVNIEGLLATAFNLNAAAAITLTAGGKTLAAVNGAYTITLGSSGSAITAATVDRAVTTLVANCAVTTLTVNAVVTNLNVNADNTTVSVGTSAGATNIVVANVSTIIQNAINTITVNIAGVTTTGKTVAITAYATANLTSLLITTGSNATQAKASAALKIAGANPLATGITWQGVSTDNSGTTAYSTTIGSPVLTFEIKKSATVTLTRL